VDVHCRDGDLLPLAADMRKQAAWRHCSKNWRLSFRAALMKELQVAGVRRTFHRGWQGMAMDRGWGICWPASACFTGHIERSSIVAPSLKSWLPIYLGQIDPPSPPPRTRKTRNHAHLGRTVSFRTERRVEEAGLSLERWRRRPTEVVIHRCR
jgi:hypothetical protein